MVALVIPTFSVWLLMANICFFMAAMARDLFILRSCLLGAYANLFLNSILGLPKAFTVYNPDGPISIDGVVSCIVIGSIHIYALWRLWKDDRDITLTDEMEVIWRLFYRRSGVLKLEFCALVDDAKIVEFKAGETIASHKGHMQNAYFVLRGVVSNHSECTVPGGETHEIATQENLKYSGTFLGIHIFSIFGIWLGEEMACLRSVARTDCTVMVFSVSALEKMFSRPPLVAAWKNLLLFEVALTAATQRGPYYCSSGSPEDELFYLGEMSLDFCRFTPEELERKGTDVSESGGPILAALAWVRRSFNPFLSSGLRHAYPVPMNGVKLRRHVLSQARGENQAPDRDVVITPPPLPAVVDAFEMELTTAVTAAANVSPTAVGTDTDSPFCASTTVVVHRSSPIELNLPRSPAGMGPGLVCKQEEV